MKISQISCSPLEYPIEFPINPSEAPCSSFYTTSCSILKIHTDEGITGDIRVVEHLRKTLREKLTLMVDVIQMYVMPSPQLSAVWSYEQDCYSIIQADAAFSEGISQLRKVAAYAEMHYKPFIPHTWSNGIGRCANLQLAGAIPNCPWFEFPIDPPACSVTARDFILVEYFHINPEGNIRVPSKTGLGIDLDENAIQKSNQFSWTSEKVI